MLDDDTLDDLWTDPAALAARAADQLARVTWIPPDAEMYLSGELAAWRIRRAEVLALVSIAASLASRASREPPRPPA